MKRKALHALALHAQDSALWTLGRIRHGKHLHIWPTDLLSGQISALLPPGDTSICGTQSVSRVPWRDEVGRVHTRRTRPLCQQCAAGLVRIEMARLASIADAGDNLQAIKMNWQHAFIWRPLAEIDLENIMSKAAIRGSDVDMSLCRAAVPGDLGFNLKQCSRVASVNLGGYGLCSQHARLAKAKMQETGSPLFPDPDWKLRDLEPEKVLMPYKQGKPQILNTASPDTPNLYRLKGIALVSKPDGHKERLGMDLMVWAGDNLAALTEVSHLAVMDITVKEIDVPEDVRMRAMGLPSLFNASDYD